MAFRSSSTPVLTGNSTSISTFVLPAGVQATDILILSAAGFLGAAPTASYTSGGAGWNFLGEGTGGASGGNVYFAWALGTAAAPVINWGGYNNAVCQITAFSGRALSAPTFAVAAINNDGTGGMIAPTVTATAGTDLLVCELNFQSTITSTTPSGTTLISSVTEPNIPQVETLVYANAVSAGTTPAYAFTSDAWIERNAFTIAMASGGAAGIPMFYIRA